MDQDFSTDYRVAELMAWLEDLEDRITPHFDKFVKVARKQEHGVSQSVVGPSALHGDMFEGEQVTNQSIYEFEKQTPLPMLQDRFDEMDFPDNRMSLNDRAAT